MSETKADKKQNLVQSLVNLILSRKKDHFLLGSGLKESSNSVINLNLTTPTVVTSIPTTDNTIASNKTDFSENLNTALVNVIMLESKEDETPINENEYVELYNITDTNTKNVLNSQYSCSTASLEEIIRKSTNNPRSFYIYEGRLIVGGRIIGDHYGVLQNASNIAYLHKEIETLKETINELKNRAVMTSDISTNTVNSAYLWVGSPENLNGAQTSKFADQTVFMTTEE